LDRPLALTVHGVNVSERPSHYIMASRARSQPFDVRNLVSWLFELNRCKRFDGVHHVPRPARSPDLCDLEEGMLEFTC